MSPRGAGPDLSLLAGAIDLHRHGWPELSRELAPPLSDIEDISLCRDVGMSGVVLKSHMWPTIGRTEHLATQVSGIEIMSSITLNEAAGGLSPQNVALAGSLGARVVYLPTWSARNDRERGGLSATLRECLGWDHLMADRGLVLTNQHGVLLPEVREVLEAARQYDMVVFTGHVSPAESLAVAESTLAAGRLVFSHPDSRSVGASLRDIKAMIDAGAVVELCALAATPHMGRTTSAEFASWVELVGSGNCVVTSDYFFPWSPPSHVLLHDLMLGLSRAGIDRAAVHEMAVAVPKRLLERQPSQARVRED